MNITQLVALGFRFGAVYCGYEAFRTSMDLISAMQVLRIPPGSSNHPWANVAAGRLSKLYTDTAGEVSTAIYQEIVIRFFEWIFFTFILWKGSVRLAYVFTEGLDKVA